MPSTSHGYLSVRYNVPPFVREVSSLQQYRLVRDEREQLGCQHSSATSVSCAHQLGSIRSALYYSQQIETSWQRRTFLVRSLRCKSGLGDRAHSNRFTSAGMSGIHAETHAHYRCRGISGMRCLAQQAKHRCQRGVQGCYGIIYNGREFYAGRTKRSGGSAKLQSARTRHWLDDLLSRWKATDVSLMTLDLSITHQP